MELAYLENGAVIKAYERLLPDVSSLSFIGLDSEGLIT